MPSYKENAPELTLRKDVLQGLPVGIPVFYISSTVV